MKRYDSYKESGAQWIGEAPSHWETCRVKHKYQLQTGFTPTSGNSAYYEQEGEGHTWVTIADMKSKFVSTSAKDISDEAIRKYNPLITPKGSLLYSFKLSVGQVAFAGANIYTNEAIASFLNSEKVCLPFWYYASQFFIEFNANTNIYGAHILNQELVKNAVIVFPPLSEQQAIASYLDKRCGVIDRTIAKQQKRIELLQELRQSIITNAVTRGINPDVSFKDSGIEWIGPIPKHWEIRRTRFVCKIQTGDKDTINRVDDGLYPFYVRSPKIERIDTYTFDGEAVLMAGDGVGAGKVFHYAKGKFDYHQRVYNLHGFKNIYGLFFYYYISSKFKYIIEEGAAKNTVDSVRLNMIQDFWITVPLIQEQQDIVNYIEKETRKIDTQISKAHHRIELLEELKQSIITETVTGKIKVC